MSYLLFLPLPNYFLRCPRPPPHPQTHQPPPPLVRPQRSQPSEAREPAERKHDAEADFQRRVVLYCAAEIYAFDVLLDAVVRDQLDVEVLFRCVEAEERKAEEEREGLGEEGDCEAGGETW